jgi:signal transduction histidine kinase/CheY-like chemotaxis protein
MSVPPAFGAQSLYQHCFERSPLAQLWVNGRGGIVQANAAARALLNLSGSMPVDATAGSEGLVNVLDRLASPDRDRLREALGQAGNWPPGQALLCRLAPLDASVANAGAATEPRWLEVQGAWGEVPGASPLWFLTLHDVSAQQRSLAELNHRSELLEALSHNLPGMIYVFQPGRDKGGRLEFVSEGVRALFGVAPQDALASPWALYGRVEPDDLDRFFQQRDTAVAAGGRLHSEFRVRNPRGELRWYAADSIAGTDADGARVRCGYITDITEHKLYLEARAAASEAERASRAKSEFLSRMSHELRTPLNAVIGFAQLLRMDTRTPLDEGQRRKVDLIERAGGHLLAVISDVLDLSRIEAGDLPLAIESQPLQAVIDDALGMVAEVVQRAGVVVHAADLLPPLQVMADRVRLRQVLVNLLSNATKYNRPNGQVWVQARREDDVVLVSVRDEGQGMREDQLQHLFEPFNRLGAEHSGIEGTGIGLVIVHRLVERMGGCIDVESAPGQGSTFTVRLPASDVAPGSEHGELDEAPAAAGQATVLYVEDNEINIALVRQILGMRPSWQLEIARSGKEALHWMQGHRPDLLLLDMHLGDMSGLDVIDELGRAGRHHDLIKVALSADAMPDRIHEARARGFTEYLTKPIDVGQLLRCLDEHLSGVRA